MPTSKSTTLLLVTLITLGGTAASDLKVDVYEGPTECEDEHKVSIGNSLKMHYTGTIDQTSETGEKGKKFDSSRDRGQPFDVVIGTGQVIKGWDEGIVGLCLGAKANLVIPPEMGYGAGGAGDDIPGGATLHFDVEVLEIAEGPPEQNIFKEIDTDSDGKISKEEVSAYFKAQHKSDATDVPDDMWAELWEREDANKDGHISWEEFSGPKGSNPMGDEL